MNPSVIITALTHPMLVECLRRRGYDVDVHEQISYTALAEVIHLYEGIIISTRLNIDAAMLSKATAMQWIGRLGSGMEIVDVDYAVSQNIHCMSSPEGNCGPVGEHCLGMLLSLMHHISWAAQEVAEGVWSREPNRGMELRGKTVGIIGYGHTGSSFCNLLAPFGVKVLAVDKYKTGFTSGYVTESSPEQLMAEAHVVSFHLPLTPETAFYANDHFFGSLQQNPVLLNASRGGVVDTAALIRALDGGKIAAAGLDVLENEALNSYTLHETEQLRNLVSRKNVLVTPHIAGYSKESLFRMPAVILEKLDVFRRSNS
jgi:D-3-phosphoglycerate dehydrogenase